MGDEAGDSTLVGVVGDETAAIVETLTAEGAQTLVDPPQVVLDADPAVVVAVGEPALLSVARERPSVPVLPVSAGAGVRSVPRDEFEPVVSRLLAGEWTVESHPLLSVDISGEHRGLALLDAMTVTTEPAHISEFTIATGGEHVDRFRADGIAVGTPAGTPGYIRAAGGPVAPPGSDVLTVVPIAPFAMTPDHWVLPPAELTITVERDEATVEVLADDRTVGLAAVDDVVRLTVADSLETIRVPAGQSPFSEG